MYDGCKCGWCSFWNSVQLNGFETKSGWGLNTDARRRAKEKKVKEVENV